MLKDFRGQVRFYPEVRQVNVIVHVAGRPITVAAKTPRELWDIITKGIKVVEALEKSTQEVSPSTLPDSFEIEEWIALHGVTRSVPQVSKPPQPEVAPVERELRSLVKTEAKRFGYSAANASRLVQSNAAEGLKVLCKTKYKKNWQAYYHKHLSQMTVAAEGIVEAQAAAESIDLDIDVLALDLDL